MKEQQNKIQPFSIKSLKVQLVCWINLGQQKTLKDIKEQQG